MFSLICTLNKWLSKQSSGWWFEMPWRSLWCHCNVVRESPRGHLNIKTLGYQLRNSHIKDKMVWLSFYFYNGNPCIWKDSLYIEEGPWSLVNYLYKGYPYSKVPGAKMGPIWGREDPGGPHVGPINFAPWVLTWAWMLALMCIWTSGLANSGIAGNWRYHWHSCGITTLVKPKCDIFLITHWGRDKIAAIWQMRFSNAFSWMKMFEFCLRFQWNLFLRFEIPIFHHWYR